VKSSSISNSIAERSGYKVAGSQSKYLHRQQQGSRANLAKRRFIGEAESQQVHLINNGIFIH